MSIDNHAAWLGEAISAISAISAGQKNHYLREIKVVFARVFPVFPIFFCIFRYENCVRKQQNVPLKLTCDVLHL